MYSYGLWNEEDKEKRAGQVSSRCVRLQMGVLMFKQEIGTRWCLGRLGMKTDSQRGKKKLGEEGQNHNGIQSQLFISSLKCQALGGYFKGPFLDILGFLRWTCLQEVHSVGGAEPVVRVSKRCVLPVSTCWQSKSWSYWKGWVEAGRGEGGLERHLEGGFVGKTFPGSLPPPAPL